MNLHPFSCGGALRYHAPGADDTVDAITPMQVHVYLWGKLGYDKDEGSEGFSPLL